jgi:hypothetical protein
MLMPMFLSTGMQPLCFQIVNALMDDKLSLLLERLRICGFELSRKQIMAGFDGFIDSIQKVILSQSENQQPEYFKTIQDFGQYISAKNAGGLSLETEEIVNKIGGNVAIMANAIAQFGVKTNCIGAFGYPDIDPVFSGMHANSSLFSFANPGTTSALEFSDGKIMLAQMTDLNQATWELIKERIGLEQIIKIIDNSEMISLLNWSEVHHTNEIWEGLLQEVLPFINPKNRKKAFFDLSDCSKHSSRKIRKALELIQSFSSWCDVTLSLNKNEAALVHQSIEPLTGDNLEVSGYRIFGFLNIDTLVIHTAARSMAWRNSDLYQSDAFAVENPEISTGAGDNFNAGFCIGQLLELETDQSLMLANLLAACYMRNGQSPGLSELEGFNKE